MKIENNSQMTQGQARRLAKKRAAVNAKKAAIRSKIFGIGAVVILVAALVLVIVLSVISSIKARKAEEERLAKLIPVVDDYSAGLDEDGFVQGVNPEDYIKLNFKVGDKIEVPYSDIEFSEKDVNDYIELLLNYYGEGDEKAVFDDDFVKNKLDSEFDAEGYKANLKKEQEEDALKDWLDDYISKNIEIIDLPDDYLLTYAGKAKYIDQLNLAAFNAQYQGSMYYEDVPSMYDMTEHQYEESITKQAGDGVARQLAKQMIFKQAGLEMTQEKVNQHVRDNNISNINEYGYGYIKSTLINEMVDDYLASLVEYVYEEDDAE